MINTSKLHSLLFFIIVSSSTIIHGTAEILSSQNNIQTAQSIDLTLPSVTSKQHKKRMRQTHKKTGKKTQKAAATYRDFSYQELSIAKDKQVASNNISGAIKYLEQMIKLCPDVASIGNHLLEIADLLLLDGQHEKAALIYTEFALLYPGSEKIEYALYRAIESSFVCLLPHDRDQTKTEETLALAENFLKQDHFTTHKDAVAAIYTQCQSTLINSDFSICSFYLKRGRLTIVKKRLEKIRTTWLPIMPNIQEQLSTLQEELIVAQNMQEAALEKINQATMRSKKMTERF